MNRCIACGVVTTQQLCHFDQRTVELVKARRCVFCAAPALDENPNRVESRCGDCLSRGHKASVGTRWVLRQAAKARYWLRSEVAA